MFSPLIPLKKPDEKDRMELGNNFFLFFFYSFELLNLLFLQPMQVFVPLINHIVILDFDGFHLMLLEYHSKSR